MDLSRLPETPRTPEDRGQLFDKLMKSAKDFENVNRNVISSQVLALLPEQIAKLTFSLAYVLAVHVTSLNSAAANDSDDWVWLRYFLERCHPDDIRWADESLETLCRVLADACAKKGARMSLHASGTLLLALRKRTSGNWGQLTTIHADLLQVCLVAKLYSLAAQVADARGTKVCERKGTNSLPKTLALDIQRVFYYSGIAYCGMQRYKDATDAFCECLTLPAQEFGAVHLEAYKKYVLASLISNGKVLALPRYTPNAIRKVVASDKSGPELLSAYQKIASAFEKQDCGAELMQLLKDKAAAELEASGNAGLLEQVLEAYWKNRIIQLTGTYVTMRMADIAQAINQPVDRTEQHMLRMIQDREIRALLDQRSGTVRFLSESEDVESKVKAASRIEAQIGKVMAITQEVQDLDKRLGTSKTFISKLTLRHGGLGRSESGDMFGM